MKAKSIKVAAIQLETRIGDVPHNIQACEQLALQAIEQGARCSSDLFICHLG